MFREWGKEAYRFQKSGGRVVVLKVGRAGTWVFRVVGTAVLPAVVTAVCSAHPGFALKAATKAATAAVSSLEFLVRVYCCSADSAFTAPLLTWQVPLSPTPIYATGIMQQTRPNSAGLKPSQPMHLQHDITVLLTNPQISQ